MNSEIDKKGYLLAAINIYSMVGGKNPVPLPLDTDSEYKFHSIRKWRLDHAYPDMKIGIEVHGGVFSHGRHVRGQGFINDREKMNEAQLHGWIVLEFATNTLLDNPIGCVEKISRAIQLRKGKSWTTK